MTKIRIETHPEGVLLAQDSPSKEFSITGKGGRTDMVFILDDELMEVIEALQNRIHQIRREGL